MTVKKTQGAYADCKQVMDLALQHPEISIDFDTRAQAITFRQRCHSFRKRLYDAAVPAPGALPSTPYDSLIFREPRENPDGTYTLPIDNRESHGLALLSRIRGAEGQPLSLEKPDEEEALRALRGSLGLE